MAGFWDSFGQGLQDAGAVMSADVYERQAKERQMQQRYAFAAQQQAQQQKAAMAQHVMTAIQSGAMDPAVGMQTLSKMGFNLPGLGASPEAQLHQEELRGAQAWNGLLSQPPQQPQLQPQQQQPGQPPGQLLTGLQMGGLVGTLPPIPPAALNSKGAQRYLAAKDLEERAAHNANSASKPLATHYDAAAGTFVLIQPDGSPKVIKVGEGMPGGAFAQLLSASGMKSGTPEWNDAIKAKITKDTTGQSTSGFAKELNDAGIKPGTPQWNDAWKKRLARETSPTTTMIMGAGGGNPLKDEGTANFWYDLYDKTGKLPPISWGSAGNPTREAFTQGFAKWKTAQGGTGADTAASQATFRAGAGALNAVSKDLNTFEPYKKMLDTNADIAIQLGGKIRQTDAALINKPLNWLRQNATSNPDVAEYLAQIQFVQTEAARVINNPRIVGQLTDEAQKEMRAVINGNAPIAVVDRVLTRLKTDGSNRFNAMRSQQAELTRQLRAKDAAPSAAPVAPATVLPPKNAQGWTLHRDGNGNQAYVSQDGKQYEEVK